MQELSIGPDDALPPDLHLPYESESLDRIECSYALAHVVDLEAVLEELVRVLKDGGRLMIEEENAYSMQVVGWEPLLRGIKRVLGSPVNARTRTPRGIEEWTDDGAGSGIMNRKIDPRFLERFMVAHGLELVERSATELTDDEVKNPTLQRLVKQANQWYLERKGPPELALKNRFVFEKRYRQNVSQSKATSTSARSSS